MLVVATTLDTDARSKIVVVVTSGESDSYVNRPKAFKAMSLSLCVIARDAPGKAHAAIACDKISNARAKMVACCSNMRAGQGAIRKSLLRELCSGKDFCARS